jgi:4-hydroxybenzoate polyprenyltransferase
LAAGVVTISQAFIIITVLFIAGTTLMTSVSFTAMNILLIYLKHMAILDVPIIAIGFALRIFLGSAVTDTPPFYAYSHHDILICSIYGAGKAQR